MKQKKFTTQQRLSRLESVVSQNYVMNKKIQQELKYLQDQLKTSDEEE